MSSSSAAARQWARLLPTLSGRGATVATAESLTGGRLAAALTGVPGSSAAYVGGVVSYATEVKVRVLGVPAHLIATHGVVSAACAQSMATGVGDLLGADYALATTGVAGPEEQDGRPVGTVYVAVAGPAGVRAVDLALTGDREAIQTATVAAAVAELAATIAAGGVR